MVSVTEIESAIRKLPESDFRKLSAWFDDLRANAWDQQIETDAKAGRLDFLFQEAQSEGEADLLKPWPGAQ